MDKGSIELFSDGGARGNPGPAAIGVVIKKDGNVVHTIHQRIGIATNNVAEYQAMLAGLTWLSSNARGAHRIVCFADSTLIVNQINGLFKVKNATLRQLLLRIHGVLAQIPTEVQFKIIPRAQNSHADALVNQALDEIPMSASR